MYVHVVVFLQVFEAQEYARINFFRNALWLHVNQLSKQCVTSDDMYEQVRKSLEMCSIEKDIEYFVNQRKTGQTPPAPIMYENFYCPQKNAAPPGEATGSNLARREPLPVPKSYQMTRIVLLLSKLRFDLPVLSVKTNLFLAGASMAWKEALGTAESVEIMSIMKTLK